MYKKPLLGYLMSFFPSPVGLFHLVHRAAMLREQGPVGSENLASFQLHWFWKDFKLKTRFYLGFGRT